MESNNELIEITAIDVVKYAVAAGVSLYAMHKLGASFGDYLYHLSIEL